MKLRYLALALVPMLLLAACATATKRATKTIKASDISCIEWRVQYMDGSDWGENSTDITDRAAIDQIASMLNAIVKNNEVSPYNKPPSLYSWLTLKYKDNTKLVVDYYPYGFLFGANLKGDNHCDCSADEYNALEKLLEDVTINTP